MVLQHFPEVGNGWRDDPTSSRASQAQNTNPKRRGMTERDDEIYNRRDNNEGVEGVASGY